MVGRRSARSYLWFLQLILQIGIGGAFVYAGWVKATDPVAFADSVASFAVLPHPLVGLFALWLPIFEIAAGLTVMIGWPKRIGALALLLLTAVFCVALLSAIARGLNINCGCFGASSSNTSPWLDFARDLLILAGCAFLYWSASLNRRATVA
jgi:putative oxidoreductase